MEVNLVARPVEYHKDVHIALDFDGTISEYHGWHGDQSTVGKPIPAMVEHVKRWLAKGYKVSIFTARLSHSHEESLMAIAAIHKFLRECGLPELPITCMKMWYFSHFIDDKAFHAVKNVGVIEGDLGI